MTHPGGPPNLLPSNSVSGGSDGNRRRKRKGYRGMFPQRPAGFILQLTLCQVGQVRKCSQGPANTGGCRQIRTA